MEYAIRVYLAVGWAAVKYFFPHAVVLGAVFTAGYMVGAT